MRPRGFAELSALPLARTIWMQTRKDVGHHLLGNSEELCPCPLAEPLHVVIPFKKPAHSRFRNGYFGPDCLAVVRVVLANRSCPLLPFGCSIAIRRLWPSPFHPLPCLPLPCLPLPCRPLLCFTLLCLVLLQRNDCGSHAFLVQICWPNICTTPCQKPGSVSLSATRLGSTFRCSCWQGFKLCIFALKQGCLQSILPLVNAEGAPAPRAFALAGSARWWQILARFSETGSEGAHGLGTGAGTPKKALRLPCGILGVRLEPDCCPQQTHQGKPTRTGSPKSVYVGRGGEGFRVIFSKINSEN